MAKSVTLVCALLLMPFLCDLVHSEPTTPKYVSYNSSDLSYLSNGIQFPATNLEIQERIIEEDAQEHLPEMEWMARLYDHHKWTRFVDLISNTRCQSDLSTYLQALNNGTSWAAKMNDASGHYGGQFFFGNDFWLGSHTLCDELLNVDNNNELPPFPVRFFVAKVRININRQLTPVTRQLNIGECLPTSCTTTDIILLLSQEQNQGASLNIVGVRPVPGDYSVWHDYKFHIVGGVGLVVTVIIIIATLVELLTKDHKQEESEDAEVQNNNNNNNVDDTKGSKENVLGKEIRPNMHRHKHGKPMKFLLCFSAMGNGLKILQVEGVSQNSIRCIHGLRFFSIAWIILVHTYLEVFAVADNKSLRTITERNFMYQTISNATFSVDTFFFISGLLVTITFFRAAMKRPSDEKDSHSFSKSLWKFFLLIVYRFFRLTPAYLFVLGVNEVLLRYLHDTSVFSLAIIDHISCSSYWWRNALYINNLFPQQEFCMLWSWYISNDTQFYILAVVILLVAARSDIHLRWAAGALGLFMVLSWITTFVIAMQYNYVARVEEPFALFDQLYDKPWLRIGPYLVGMIAGYILFRINCTLRIPPILVVVGWILSLSCLASVVYGLGREGLVIPASAFYASLGHTAWGLSLGWITLACCCGYGGPINGLLSFRGFLPLSRLTYCAFLIHPVIMCLTSFMLDGPIHLHNYLVHILYFGNVVVSFLVAFFISLAFEAPVVNLLKLIF